MKLLISVFSFLLLFTISCTNECKDVNCNNGTCDEGSCLCDTGYEGEDCSIEMRTKFIGTWTGTMTCDDGFSETDFKFLISEDKNDIQKIIIDDSVETIFIAKVKNNIYVLDALNFGDGIATGDGLIDSEGRIKMNFDLVRFDEDDAKCAFTGTK